jgi:hypothetical protein
MRQAFNFYRSYWEVANELNDKDRLAFYDALLTRQFTGEETELKGLVKLVYLSQKHSIDKQIKGYEDKTKRPLLDPTQDPTQGGTQGPSVQEKEKGKEQEKLKYTLEERKKSFAHSLAFYLETYGKEMIREFYDYWTEHGEHDKKMRFEKQSSFNLELRLKRWNKNVQERNKPKVNLPTEIWEG